MSRYYIWHDNQVKTSDNWDEVLNCGGAYVMSLVFGKSAGKDYGYVLPQGHQWMSISPGDIPKEFVLGLLLLDIHL